MIQREYEVFSQNSSQHGCSHCFCINQRPDTKISPKKHFLTYSSYKFRLVHNSNANMLIFSRYNNYHVHHLTLAWTSLKCSTQLIKSSFTALWRGWGGWGVKNTMQDACLQWWVGEPAEKREEKIPKQQQQKQTPQGPGTYQGSSYFLQSNTWKYKLIIKLFSL